MKMDFLSPIDPAPSIRLYTDLWNKFYPFIIISLAFLLCCLLVSPVYEVPQNDDWAYYLTLKSWVQTGTLTHNGWNDPTFIFQASWGMLFVKFLGLSYTTLRISTLVLAWMGTLALYLILIELHIDRTLALLGALLLIFNPLVLVLSYSFNTDVPYLSLAIIAQYFLLKALKNSNLLFFIITGIVLACAILVRQSGFLILAVSVIYALLFFKSQFKLFSIIALITPTILAISFYLEWMSHQAIQGWPFVSNNSLVLINSSSFTEQLLLFKRGILNSLYLFLNIPLLVLPIFLLFSWHSMTRSNKYLFGLFFIIMFLVCGLSHELGYGEWPYFKSYLKSRGVFIQSGPRLINNAAQYLIALIIVAGAAIFLTKLVSVLSEFRKPDSHYVCLFLTLGLAQFIPSAFMLNIYDRYAIVFLPSFIILTIYSLSQTNSLKKARALSLITLFFILNVDILRGYVAYSSARWQIETKLTDIGILSSQIGSSFEWEGATLYEIALHKYKKRPPYEMNQKTFPWKSFQTAECEIGHFDHYLLSEEYRGPLWAGYSTIGVRNNNACRIAIASHDVRNSNLFTKNTFISDSTK